MSSNENNNVHHSAPIAIDTRHPRDRSGSVSDAASSTSSDSLPSPSSHSAFNSYPITQPRVVTPSTSPILSYFLSGQSPKGSTATFPFRRNFGAPVFEDDETEAEPAISKHARRASTAWAGGDRVQPPPVTGAQQDRAAGLLRRLSLGGRPPIPTLKPGSGAAAPSAVSGRTATPPPNTPTAETPRRARRANTLNPGGRPKRAPSPMGERMLSGHFDGFN